MPDKRMRTGKVLSVECPDCGAPGWAFQDDEENELTIFVHGDHISFGVVEEGSDEKVLAIPSQVVDHMVKFLQSLIHPH